MWTIRLLLIKIWPVEPQRFSTTGAEKGAPSSILVPKLFMVLYVNTKALSLEAWPGNLLADSATGCVISTGIDCPTAAYHCFMKRFVCKFLHFKPLLKGKPKEEHLANLQELKAEAESLC